MYASDGGGVHGKADEVRGLREFLGINQQSVRTRGGGKKSKHFAYILYGGPYKNKFYIPLYEALLN